MTGVLVTGATGKTGSVLAALLRADGVPVRVAGRRPPAGDPDAVRFDWAVPATHASALRGTDRVYLVPPRDTVDPMPLVAPFLARAERLGVRRVVLLGSAVVLPNAPGALQLAAWVRSRPGWVVLRASGFMQNFLSTHPMGERIRRHGEIRTAAGAGRLGWIDARDIAGAAHALLTDPGGDPASQGGLGADTEAVPGSDSGPDYVSATGRAPDADRAPVTGVASVTGITPATGCDYVLTGPQALSYQGAAALITARTGRPIRVLPARVDELAAGYRDAGMPAEFAAALAAVDDSIRAGREDVLSTAVLDLTGRPPRPFAEFVEDHATTWTDARPHGR